MFRIGTCSKANFRPFEMDILDIIHSSRRNNKDLGIAGLLYYDGENFLHILDGERTKVQEVHARVLEDKRHSQTTNFNPDDFSIPRLPFIGLEIATTGRQSFWAKVIKATLIPPFQVTSIKTRYQGRDALAENCARF